MSAESQRFHLRLAVPRPKLQPGEPGTAARPRGAPVTGEVGFGWQALSKSDIVDLACLPKSDGALTERFHVLSFTAVDVGGNHFRSFMLEKPKAPPMSARPREGRCRPPA
jgi:hypothetical protein